MPKKKSSWTKGSDTRPPHDASYKSMFSHPLMVRRLLEGFVQEKWVKEIDFGSLKALPPGFVDALLRERTGDILWEARLKDHKVFVLLMFEFQSRVDRWMGLRILNYTVLLYQGLLKGDKENLVDGLLPAVFPVVIYNGSRRWTAPRSISQLIHPSPEGLERYRPGMEFFVLDLGRESLDELPSGNPVSSIIGLERGPDPVSFSRIARELDVMLPSPEYDSLRQVFTEWILRSILPRLAPGELIRELHRLEEVAEMSPQAVISWAERARREGLKEGRREGKREGRQEGKEEGRLEQSRELVHRLLTRRFGPAPEWVEQRLSGASLARLEIWAERLLDASALEEVFQDT